MNQNRHQRRAGAKLPKLPEVPSISGDPLKRCSTCKFSGEHEHFIMVAHLARQPPSEPDVIPCLYEPGGLLMRTWGFCFKWEKKDGHKDKANT